MGAILTALDKVMFKGSLSVVLLSNNVAPDKTVALLAVMVSSLLDKLPAGETFTEVPV